MKIGKVDRNLIKIEQYWKKQKRNWDFYCNDSLVKSSFPYNRTVTELIITNLVSLIWIFYIFFNISTLIRDF